jgi:hypothetical protein
MKVYGAEDLPHADSTLSYKNGKLSYIEQPYLVAKHLETLSIDEYYDKVRLLQNTISGLLHQ